MSERVIVRNMDRDDVSEQVYDLQEAKQNYLNLGYKILEERQIMYMGVPATQITVSKKQAEYLTG